MEIGKDQGDHQSRKFPLSGIDNTILSNFHRGDFLTATETGTKIIDDLGAIKGLSVPSTWPRSDRIVYNGHSTSFQRPDDDATRISFISHNLGIKPRSVAALEELTQESSQLPRLLFSEAAGSAGAADTQKRFQTTALFDALAGALGSTNVGDNQLTSAAQRHGARKHSFHVENARIEMINGKKALAIDGWFAQADEFGHEKSDANGPIKRHYSGIFTAGADGESINELYLQSDSELSFTASKAPFRSVIKSIEW